MTDLQFHPLANLFPLIEGEEFRELVEDVRAHGLREAVVLHEGMILDGRNRWRACQAAQAECRFEMFSGGDPLAFVVSVNLRRRHLSESQRAMVAAKLANMTVGRPREDNPANLPNIPPAAPQVTQAEAARLLNVSDRSLRAAKAVQDDATPELVAKVEAGEVSVSAAADVARLPEPEQREIVAKGEREILDAAKRIRAEKAEARRAERVEKLAEIAKGNIDLNVGERFPVVLADPPWRYEHAETLSREIENHYPTMDLDAIKALPVSDTATDDAVLFMWVTSPKLLEGMEVLASWGFTYRTCMVWVKDKIGMGYWARQQHELVLIATRGQMPTPAPADRPASVFRGDRTEHSAKPEVLHEIIERAFPGLPKIELFCRSPRDGWAVWGNQSAAA